MSATEALKAARDAGVRVRIDRDDLVLEATAPPPPAVLNLLSGNKTGIVMLLRRVDSGWPAEEWQDFFDERAGISEFDGGLPRPEAEARAFEACLVEWSNRNPAPSRAGRCTGCGRSESISAVVLPFGTEPGTHAWLHAECWQAWSQARRADAIAALAKMGIQAPTNSGRAKEQQQRNEHG
jgi:hypothetical protein